MTDHNLSHGRHQHETPPSVVTDRVCLHKAQIIRSDHPAEQASCFFANFDSSCEHAGGCKDIDLMQRLAKESNVPLPLADIIMSHEREAEQQGNGDKDWGCIADIIRNKAGLSKR